MIDIPALDAALDALPKRFAGPGGVAGVMHNGQIIAARAWGFANLDTAQSMTIDTRLPICSISKQFTCQVLLATIGDPARLDARVAEFLPSFTTTLPSLRQLCDNQSGLRDYWALTVLQGAFAEQTFRREDALPLIARMKTGHFPPGTQYSYSNGNFRVISELIESETGTGLETLYRQHIWGPAGMKTTTLTADTRQPEDGVVGYEGSDATGHFPAQNAIYWVGDAGISASLADMLAYERWIDATRDDPTSLYRQIAVPPVFADGTPAHYGFGLGQDTIAGLPVTRHGGALRGFRCERMNSRDARLSVVVMFNHEASAYGAAESLIHAALGHKPAVPPPLPEGWAGQWIDPDGLLVRLTAERLSATLHHATTAETLTAAADGRLTGAGVTLSRVQGGLCIARSKTNTTAKLTPLPMIDAANANEIAGSYGSDELEATLDIVARDGGVSARFCGMLGTGRMERMAPVGPDVWIIATRRSMDAPAPGDWTVIIRRDDTGAVAGLTLGCALARGISYTRL